MGLQHVELGGNLVSYQLSKGEGQGEPRIGASTAIPFSLPHRRNGQLWSLHSADAVAYRFQLDSVMTGFVSTVFNLCHCLAAVPLEETLHYVVFMQ